MQPMDLVRLGQVQIRAFDLENDPASAAVARGIVADVEHLSENGSSVFGRRFETLRADLHRNARGLPSTSFRAAAIESTVVGNWTGK